MFGVPIEVLIGASVIAGLALLGAPGPMGVPVRTG
jgi:hypothetical protein